MTVGIQNRCYPSFVGYEITRGALEHQIGKYECIINAIIIVSLECLLGIHKKMMRSGNNSNVY